MSSCLCSQRRQINGNNVEAIKEVFAKTVFFDRARQISIRRRDHPNVDWNRLRPSHPFKLPLLKKSQQFGLQLGRDVSDFVEKHRAAVSQLHFTFLQLMSPCERSVFMPEELAFEQILSQDRRN